MTDGPDKIRWLRYATKEGVARLVAGAGGRTCQPPMIMEAVRTYKDLPSVTTLAAIIAEAIARSPMLQEFVVADIDPEEELEITKTIRLTVSEEMERLRR
jgi:hypothetical protein